MILICGNNDKLLLSMVSSSLGALLVVVRCMLYLRGGTPRVRSILIVLCGHMYIACLHAQLQVQSCTHMCMSGVFLYILYAFFWGCISKCA
jgi:hypothetical protein